ncbi:MAG: methylmalonic aciduria and homocystinuria type D protein [Microcoleaceae cyanobacterium]
MPNSDITRIEAISAAKLGIEIYQSNLSQFVAQNLDSLLPEWSAKTARTVLILQQSQFPLDQQNAGVKQEKDRLRHQFLSLSLSMVEALNHQGFCSDVFDPQTGDPVFSRRGSLTHDDVAVVKALLNFPTTDDCCSGLIHPLWQTAVYPGVLITAATPTVTAPLFKQILLHNNWVMQP